MSSNGLFKKTHPTGVSGELAYAEPLTELEEELPKKGVFLIGGNFYQIKEFFEYGTVILRISKLE